MIALKQMAETDQDEFEFFRRSILERAGITLSDAKRDLVRSRLRSRVQELHLSGLRGYRELLENLPREHLEWQVFVNLLTTNKTDWFREPAHYVHLVDDVVPGWIEEKRKVSVWCAACSTGEEPYTTAMVLKKSLGPSASFEILGTDIDTEVLATAKNGVYQKGRLEQVPADYRTLGFSLGTGEISSWMKVRPEVKKHVSFSHLNIVEKIPAKSAFDLILCRNVLIYFSKETIKRVTDNLYAAAAPGAYLYIGHSESLQNIDTPWAFVSPSIFVKKKAGK